MGRTSSRHESVSNGFERMSVISKLLICFCSLLLSQYMWYLLILSSPSFSSPVLIYLSVVFGYLISNHDPLALRQLGPSTTNANLWHNLSTTDGGLDSIRSSSARSTLTLSEHSDGLGIDVCQILPGGIRIREEGLHLLEPLPQSGEGDTGTGIDVEDVDKQLCCVVGDVEGVEEPLSVGLESFPAGVEGTRHLPGEPPGEHPREDDTKSPDVGGTMRVRIAGCLADTF